MSNNLVPPPPPDPVLENRIVKIAVNVVANGPNFEAYVRDREGDKPEFSFMKGGLYSEYYEYMKQVEAAKCKSSFIF